MAERRRRALLPRLRAYDRELAATPMPIGAKNRIAASLAAEADRRAMASTRRRWIPMATFAAGAACVMAVVGYGMLGTRTTATQDSPRIATLAGYAVEGAGCKGRSEGEVAVLSGECRLVGPQLAVRTWEETRLVPQPRAVAVHSGHAMFDVEKVEPGSEPVRIVVSHGVIEVLGTRFTIEQDDGGGTVDLFEGRIRFVHPDGATVDIQPGQRYAWGDRAAPPPPPVQAEAPDVAPAAAVGEAVEPVIVIEDDPPQPRPRATAPAPLEASEIIERVAALRAEGRFADAANVLRKALRRKWDRRTGQVLSYELGQILERHLGDTAAACKHWQRHQVRYPEGRYAGAVAQSLLECE